MAGPRKSTVKPNAGADGTNDDEAREEVAAVGKAPTRFMQQFHAAKKQHPDAIIFFRLGDFYELFFDDARRASAILGLTLTKRGFDEEGYSIPMAGVPHHASSEYLARLLEAGEKVALCEQMADPATVKGIVPREVVRVVSSGLCLEAESLDARRDNYVAAIQHAADGFGIAAYELTTGTLMLVRAESAARALAELVRLEPRELLGEGSLLDSLPGVAFSLSRTFLRRDVVRSATSLEMLRASMGAELGRVAEGSVLEAALDVLAYAQSSQPAAAIVVERIESAGATEELFLDEAAVRSLELVRTAGGEKKGSLLHALDETCTPMGARLLRRRLLAPLSSASAIRRRLDCVEALVLDPRLRDDLVSALRAVRDLERLATRVSLGVATPRDLGAIRDSLVACEQVALALSNRERPPGDDPLGAFASPDLVPEIRDRLDAALIEAPPAIDRQGGIFRAGFHLELDDLRSTSDGGRDLVLELERRERDRTGISSLKVKYNRVFGYSIEVTRSNLGSVPKDYVRKQTIANGERYVTDELGALEDRILHAEEHSIALESRLFVALRGEVAEQAPRIRRLALAMAELDVHLGLATVAHRDAYVRPLVDDSLVLDLRAARHPVVEKLAASGRFVPNDIVLDADPAAEGVRLAVITGPNMAGKSTAMRQTAIAVILAQMGGFVPADSAHIGLVDKLYSRVGASDDLSRGQSTFMVEMRETATILRGATARSLVIVDEIGRGTSTYDGLAIAWAVAEHLHDAIGCRVLFATHYHELCELASTRSGVENWNVAAREHGDDIVFLHRLVAGGANRSYGISVARLAGVPPIVLARAKTMLIGLEGGDALPSGAPARMRPLDKQGRAQLELFTPAPVLQSEVEKTLGSLDVDRMTPLDALVALARLRAMLGPKESR
jgi:DNA mismatch repair protein MutS